MALKSVFIMIGMMAGILLTMEIGRRVGLRRWANIPPELRNMSPTMEASIFGLMGLLVAFTMYGAASRFEMRRFLIAQEANAVGTAFLRIDLVPPDAQPKLRDDFRKYLHSRLDVYQHIPDVEAVTAALDRSRVLQNKVWSDAIEAIKTSSPAVTTLVVTSLNDMIDITTVRTVALSTHPPPAVFALLAISVIASSALAGYSMSAHPVRNWILILAFAFTLGAALYVTLDYEFPRVGLIRIDSADQVLSQTLKNMK